MVARYRRYLETKTILYKPQNRLCEKTSMLLDALNRMRIHTGKKEMEALINNHVYSNFIYCRLVWRFTSCKFKDKTEKIRQRVDNNVYSRVPNNRRGWTM